MDIQKQREAFEAWWEDFHNGRQIACDYVEEDNSYAVGYANAQWVAWQAAKAQKVAVPEGFVLVEKPQLAQLMANMDSLGKKALGDDYVSFLDIAKALTESQGQIDLSKFDGYVPMQSRSKEQVG